jgi:hypothetical protein
MDTLAFGTTAQVQGRFARYLRIIKYTKDEFVFRIFDF